jgi:hypothetical protein
MISFYTFAGKRKTQCQYKKKVNRAGARVKKLVIFSQAAKAHSRFARYLQAHNLRFRRHNGLDQV